MKLLNQSFYERGPDIVAKDLLGKLVLRELEDGTILSGVIVETEAYFGSNDKAAHAARGETKANKSLFGPAGHAYVHSIHRYNCLDFVCESERIGSSVLIRALEPMDGIDQMRQLRNKDSLLDLTSGPGKLGVALKITKDLDGIDITSKTSKLRVYEHDWNIGKIGSSERIGISKSKELPMRFFVVGNEYVSE